MTIRIIAVALFSIAFILPASAFGADEGKLTGIAVTSRHAPIVVTKCFGAKTAETESDNAQIWEGVDFANHGKKTTSAVRFRFRFYNGFNELVDTQYGTATVPLGPGESNNDVHWETVGSAELPDGKAAWVFVNIYSDVRIVKCDVVKVAYSDGSRWSI